MMLKKILSYIYPITIYSENSENSKTLEVTLYNGKHLLNTKNTNYSYGSLQIVLKKGLIDIGKQTICKMDHVLVLGVAGGSVVKTLIDDFEFKNKITGVEIDKNVIKIANTYFNLDRIPNFTCEIIDAQKFVSNTKNKYDLIIIDIFNDNEMPAFLFEDEFIFKTKQLLNINGYILFNIMDIPKNKKILISEYLIHFDDDKYSKNVLKNIEKYNDLILICKNE